MLTPVQTDAYLSSCILQCYCHVKKFMDSITIVFNSSLFVNSSQYGTQHIKAKHKYIIKLKVCNFFLFLFCVHNILKHKSNNFIAFTPDSTRELHLFHSDLYCLPSIVYKNTYGAKNINKNISRLSVNLFKRVIFIDLKNGLLPWGRRSRQNQQRNQSPYEQLKLIPPCFTLNPECITRTGCQCQTEALYRWDGGRDSGSGYAWHTENWDGFISCVMCPAWFRHRWMCHFHSMRQLNHSFKKHSLIF